MKIQTVKLWRKNRSVEEVKKQLAPIDIAKEITIDIRVPFVTKGSQWHMTIPTHIFMKEKENRTLVTCYGQITKPFFLSLAFGVFSPLPALVNNEVLMYILLCLTLFTVVFAFFFNRIVYTTRDYLKKLQTQATHNQKTE